MEQLELPDMTDGSENWNSYFAKMSVATRASPHLVYDSAIPIPDMHPRKMRTNHHQRHKQKHPQGLSLKLPHTENNPMSISIKMKNKF